MQDKMEQQIKTKDMSKRVEFEVVKNKDILDKVKEVLGR